MNDQHYRQRQKIAAFHTLWELGQARAALRRMGEVLEEPSPRSREAFADAIYNLTGDGHGGPGVARGSHVAHPSIPPAPHHFSVLPGGEENPLAGVPAQEGAATGQAPRHGDRPLRVVAKQPGAHPSHNFNNEEA